MALNIGQIYFGVDADTTGLQKAIRRLQMFEQATNKVARTQTRQAQQAAAAMSRQEQAIHKAFQQVKNLQQQLRKANKEGMDPNTLSQVSKAFASLTKQLTNGRVSVVEFNRSVDAFNARMGRAKRQLRDFNANADKNKTGITKWIWLMRDLESSAVLALGPLSGLGARIRSLGAIFGRSSFKLALLVTGIAGAVIGTTALVGAAIKAGSAMKSLSLRFEAATGTSQKGNIALKFTLDLAKRLGLNVNALARSYARFMAASQGTALEGRKSRVIFTQVAHAAAALKLDALELEGVMRALEQMMSKGTVQAEELRGQLGDRLPGAFRIAAKAMGMTTQELNAALKAGEVLAEDFIPKLAEALYQDLGQKGAKNVNTLSGAIENLKTQALELGDSLNKLPNMFSEGATFSSAGVAILQAFEKSLGAIKDIIDEISGVEENLGELYVKGGDPFGAASGTLRALSTSVEALNEETEESSSQGRKLSKAYKEWSDGVKELSNEYVYLTDALTMLGRVPGDIDFLVKVGEFMVDVDKMSTNVDDLAQGAEVLSRALGRDVSATPRAIAEAYYELGKRVEEAQAKVERIKDSPEILKRAREELAEMKRVRDALREGPDEAKLYDTVTKKVNEYTSALNESVYPKALIARLSEEYRAVLMEILALEAKHKEEAKAAAEALREKARAQQKAEKAMKEASRQIASMRNRVAALAKGPDSLEVFTKVEEPLRKFKERLVDAGVSTEQIVELTRQYNEVLVENFRLTGRFARYAQDMARAITNSLEDIIIKGGSVKDMLHDLAKELLRVMLRALFLDSLQSALGGLFGGKGIFPSILPIPGAGGATGGGGGGGTGGGGPWGMAQGGEFKVPGSGGADRAHVSFWAKPGEVVSVRRVDQIMAGGKASGGGGVVINQYNNFEGTSSDPSVLIPVLEENNRKLKAEFLLELDRGAYA